MINRCMKDLVRRWPRTLAVVLIGLALAGCSRGAKETAPEPKLTAETPKVQHERTALDDYVAAPDTNYCYHLISTNRGKHETICVLEMTSQAWLTTNEV